MSEFALVKSPEVLAVEINAIKQQAQTMMLQALSEIGKRLIEAKEQVEHGEWGKWLQENVEYSQRTANELMKFYKEYSANSQTFANLTSHSKAFLLLGINAEERQAFVEEHDVENLSARELKKLMKEKQQLEKKLEKQEEDSAKTEREKELLAKDIAELEAQLAEVRSNRDDETASEIGRLSKELEASRSRAEKLEADLKAKPLEATTATVTEEVVPDEVKEELEQLRQKEAAYEQEIQTLKEQLAQQAEQAPEDIFKVHFKNVLEEFKATIDAFNKVTDEDAKEKFSKSLSALVEKMKVSVDGVNA